MVVLSDYLACFLAGKCLDQFEGSNNVHQHFVLGRLEKFLLLFEDYSFEDVHLKGYSFD